MRCISYHVHTFEEVHSVSFTRVGREMKEDCMLSHLSVQHKQTNCGVELCLLVM